MIDSFALAISHGLLMLTAWRLLTRPDLDNSAEPGPQLPAKPERGFRKRG
jgi:hypothetical protein